MATATDRLRDDIAAVRVDIAGLKTSNDQSKEDRNDLKLAMKENTAVIGDMRSTFLAMTQTMQSLSGQLATLNTEKCGERLDRIEGVLPEELKARLAAVEARTLRFTKLEANAIKYLLLLALGVIVIDIGSTALTRTALTLIGH